jgi:CheY-like chemotaxis protein
LPLSILIVDDVASNRDLLSAYFEDTPHKIMVAENGEQAIELAQSTQPNLIFLDLVMPPPDGKAVLKMLKANEKTKNIPVVMVTASIQEQDMKELQTLAQGFLRKPVSRNAIAQELKRLFPRSVLRSPLDEIMISTSTTSMSVAAREKLPQLLALLEQEETEVWGTLHQTLIMDQLRVFAARLQKWATEYQSPELQSYVNTLITQIHNFDLTNLPDTVAAFPDIKTQLQQLLD